MRKQDMLDLIKEHMHLETLGDVDGVMATLTPDVIWGTETTVMHSGSSAVADHYRNTITPPGQFTVKNFQGWADPDNHTAVGYWQVARPDGKEYPVLAVFEFRHGLICCERLFHDGSAPGCSRG